MISAVSLAASHNGRYVNRRSSQTLAKPEAFAGQARLCEAFRLSLHGSDTPVDGGTAELSGFGVPGFRARRSTGRQARGARRQAPGQGWFGCEAGILNVSAYVGPAARASSHLPPGNAGRQAAEPGRRSPGVGAKRDDVPAVGRREVASWRARRAQASGSAARAGHGRSTSGERRATLSGRPPGIVAALRPSGKTKGPETRFQGFDQGSVRNEDRA